MILEWVAVIIAVLILSKLAFDYGKDKGDGIGYKEGTRKGYESGYLQGLEDAKEHKLTPAPKKAVTK
jgi:flagellar biosynthesis/type III secretory pathway protein FliH